MARDRSWGSFNFAELLTSPGLRFRMTRGKGYWLGVGLACREELFFGQSVKGDALIQTYFETRSSLLLFWRSAPSRAEAARARGARNARSLKRSMSLLGQRDSVANKGKSSVAPLGLARIFFLFPSASALRYPMSPPSGFATLGAEARILLGVFASFGSPQDRLRSCPLWKLRCKGLTVL